MTRVLVIDDDKLIRNALQAALKRRRFTVRLAQDGVEGLREIAWRPVDSVFVDIFMPGMDGFEFMRALRKADHQTPVIVMSGVRICPPHLFGGSEGAGLSAHGPRTRRGAGAAEAVFAGGIVGSAGSKPRRAARCRNRDKRSGRSGI